MAITWKTQFNLKEEIPTTRFWLMCKMKFMNTKSGDLFNKRWLSYIADFKKELVENMNVIDTSGGKPKDAKMEKNNMAQKTIEKIERSAYLTIPSSFLTTLNIPRVLRH